MAAEKSFHGLTTGLDLRRLLLPASLVLAAAFKLYLALAEAVPFNADEAVVALMARHILQGERPVFFYGQAYMGSMDAFLAAAGFLLFGQQVWVIRLVQGLLYLGVLLTTAILGELAFGSRQVGVGAAWLLAIPVVNLSLYTTASLGGYGEALLWGNLILILALRIAERLEREGRAPAHLWLLWGFLAGSGLWVFGLTLVYSLPAAAFLALKWFGIFGRGSAGRAAPAGRGGEAARTARKSSSLTALPGAMRIPGLVILGGALGAGPWLFFGLQHGFVQLVWELRGGAIAGVEGLPWFQLAGQHLLTFLALGLTAVFGLRPPWAVHWLGLPLLPLALLFWLGTLALAGRALLRGEAQREGPALLLIVIACLAAGFILTPFGGDPSGRYFLPLSPLLALFAAAGVERLARRFGPRAWALIALALAYQLWGNLESMRLSPARLTTQFYPITQIDHRYDGELATFLRRQGATRGYTNYWVAYPLAFLSQEELLFAPRLPYHADFRYTERDDRFPPYLEQVRAAHNPAYITTHHPALDDYLRSQFRVLGVSWAEKRIGDYQVFYNLSRHVDVQEIGLGQTVP